MALWSQYGWIFIAAVWVLRAVIILAAVFVLLVLMQVIGLVAALASLRDQRPYRTRKIDRDAL